MESEGNPVNLSTETERFPLLFELLERIALRDAKSWNALLTIPEFGLYSLSETAKRKVIQAFKTEIKEKNKCYSFIGKGQGRLHSFFDEPAEIGFSRNGNVHTMKWYHNGVLHRGNGMPAEISHDSKGSPLDVGYFYKGQLHSYNDLPAKIALQRSLKMWYSHGMIHREQDLPAVVYYLSEGGVVECNAWFRNGKLHRDFDMPAVTCVNKGPFSYDETIEKKEWFSDGLLHRCNGPARVSYTVKEGLKVLRSCDFWIQGKKPSEETCSKVVEFSQDSVTFCKRKKARGSYCIQHFSGYGVMKEIDKHKREVKINESFIFSMYPFLHLTVFN